MELNLIRQGRPRAIESGTHSQSIIDGSNGIIRDTITHLITDHSQMSLKGDSFPFDKKEASTLMFTPFVESFLTRNQHICTAGIVGASRPNHSRIFSPGMNEDAVFLLSVVKASTVVSSLSAIWMSLRTVLPTLFPLKISSCIPGENIRL